MNWAYYLTTIALVITAFGILTKLIVGKKDATIQTLTEKNIWLDKQLEWAKEHRPDVLAERLSKRISLLESELSKLAENHDKNEVIVSKKEEELSLVRKQIDELEGQVKRAQEVFIENERLRELVDVCPICEEGLCGLEYIELGRLAVYAYGYSELDGVIYRPCPTDPEFPRIEDYALKTQYNEKTQEWWCIAEPQTEMAKLVDVEPNYGATEQEAKDRLRDWYETYAKD